MTLTRRTPLRRGSGLTTRTALARARHHHTPPPERDWSDALAKVKAEGRCRVCGKDRCRLESAHTIGREHDRPKPHPDVIASDGPLWVDPRDVVALCAEHHRAFDARELDLLPYLSKDEQASAVAHVGIIAATHRLTGSR